MSMVLFHQVLATPIKPAGAKLVISVLAVWAKDDGIVAKRHSFGFLGKCCGLSPDQAARHIKALTNGGFLTQVKAPTKREGGQYALEIGALMPLPEHFKFATGGGTHAPSEGAPTPPETGHPRPLRGGTHAPQSNSTKNGNVFGGEEASPSGSAAGPPPLGAGVVPDWIEAGVLNTLRVKNPKRNLKSLVDTAVEYHNEGVTTEAINAELVDMAKRQNAYKLRLIVPKAPAPPRQTKRTRGPKTGAKRQTRVDMDAWAAEHIRIAGETA